MLDRIKILSLSQKVSPSEAFNALESVSTDPALLFLVE